MNVCVHLCLCACLCGVLFSVGVCEYDVCMRVCVYACLHCISNGCPIPYLILEVIACIGVCMCVNVIMRMVVHLCVCAMFTDYYVCGSQSVYVCMCLNMNL